jgi:aspartyl aminopeptidase
VANKNKNNSWKKSSQSLLDFINASPTQFHAVAELQKTLIDNGFIELRETGEWQLVAGEKYFVTRNDSSMIAFIVGAQPAEETGFQIIGAHTDSPNLRLKPNSFYTSNGYSQLAVEVYGGVLLGTWTDRDLSLAGRVILVNKKKQTSRLIRFNQPLLRIPQLAIHLNREVNEKGLILNKQKHLPPILSLSTGGLSTEKKFMEMIAGELGCRPGEIISMDLALYDVQEGTLAGPDCEFIYAGRLDNLSSCHAATSALIAAPQKTKFTRVLAFYDHEEVGSETAQGGASPFLKHVLERICLHSARPREALMRAVAASLFISADMAHAVHPNYSDKHDSRHLPVINQGPVIKSHSGQRYATDAVSSAKFESLCKSAGVAVQKFVVRSDMMCGSTIGPITAANLGIRTVDVGNPMLSMHSIREMAGSRDHDDLIKVFQEFFTVPA